MKAALSEKSGTKVYRFGPLTLGELELCADCDELCNGRE